MPDGLNRVALSSRLIAAAGLRREILLFSTERGRLETQLPTSYWVTALAFLPNGTLAAATAQGTIELWDPIARRVVQVLSLM